MTSIESSDRATVLIHFYRAMVGRADIWRMRMDATTNWAIATTAAIVSFALGNPQLPHYVVLIASLLTVCFLLLEARRLTFYHLWQKRVLELETGMIRPALRASEEEGASISLDDSMLEALDLQLGHTVPTMRLRKAAARRLRRVYTYLFAAQWMAWMLKLSTHPEAATSVEDAIARAKIAGAPGEVCFGISLLLLSGVVAIAVFKGGREQRTEA